MDAGGIGSRVFVRQRWTPSTSLERLALSAALSEPEIAVNDWNALVSDVPIEALDHSILRQGPRIYRNLAGNHAALEYRKLSGSFRSSWASQHSKLSPLSPIFVRLERESLDYRVIKGLAVAALTKSFGQRVFGDVDLAVGLSNIEAVSELLRDLGYSRHTASPEGFSGVWLSPHTMPIDVHVVEEQRGPIRAVFEAPPVQASALGATIQVPPASYLVAIAIWHAEKASSRTDFLQTLVDVASLDDQARLGSVTRLTRRFHLVPTVSQVGAELAAIGKPAQSLPVVNPLRARMATVTKAPGIGKRFHYWSQALNRAFHRSRLSCRKATIARLATGAPVLYRFWLRTGSIRLIERAVCRVMGGFFVRLPDPPDSGFAPALDFRSRIVVERSGDYRLRVAPHQTQSGKSIRAFAVYLSGIFCGHTSYEEPGLVESEVSVARGDHELSLRPLEGCGTVDSIAIELIPRGQGFPVFQATVGLPGEGDRG